MYGIAAMFSLKKTTTISSDNYWICSRLWKTANNTSEVPLECKRYIKHWEEPSQVNILLHISHKLYQQNADSFVLIAKCWEWIICKLDSISKSASEKSKYELCLICLVKHSDICCHCLVFPTHREASVSVMSQRQLWVVQQTVL